MGLHCLHRNIVISYTFPFGCLGAILYRPSLAVWIWLGGAVQAGAGVPGSHMVSARCWDGGELLQSIILHSLWPASGYLVLGCLGGSRWESDVCGGRN